MWAAWVSQGADSETEIRVQDIFRGLLLQYQHLWKGREEKEVRLDRERSRAAMQFLSFLFFFFFLILAGSGLGVVCRLVALQHVGS